MKPELQAALRRLPVPLLQFDSDGTLRPVNSAARALFARECLEEDLLRRNPAHPLAELLRQAAAGHCVRSRSLTLGSGCRYSVVVSEPPHEQGGVVMLLQSAADIAQGIERFTARETEVARLLVTGATSKEICSRLAIAQSTLKSHLASLFQKSGTRTRAALIAHLLRRR